MRFSSAGLQRGQAGARSRVPTEAVATADLTVFVFPGHRLCRTSSAVELFNSAPAFADEMRLCDEAFAELLGWSLLDAVHGDIASPTLDRVEVMQPVSFAVTVSLAAYWRSAGIEPDAVLGHSHGEIAAAYVAGALSLRDAARVVTVSSGAIGTLAGAGGMVAMALPVGRTHAVIEPWGRSLSVAAHNAPSSTVVTGDAAALTELMAECERAHVEAARLPVDCASHSSQVESLRELLRDRLSGIQPQVSKIGFVSAVTGAGLDTSILDGDYWYANVRQPVLFEQAVRWLCERGHRTFLEMSAQPELTPGIRELLQEYRSFTAGESR